jgi:methylglutaconyl-CoA hydratase
MGFVAYSLKNRIGTITLNRPEKRNALNALFVAELTDVFSQAEQDPAVKIIILAANGEAFCAGADLEYMESLLQNSFEENLQDSQNLMGLFKKIYSCSKVTIACVQGHAIAGGCGLATVCDFVFSTPESLFGYTEVKIGFVPALVSVFLVRRLGESRTKELLLTGELLAAPKALEIGLVNFISDSGQIMEKVIIFATGLCQNTSSNSIQVTKELIIEIQNLDLHSGLELAAVKNAEVRASEDFKKGIQAFLRKEKPSW